MAIPDQFVDELVARTDIVDLVSGYVRLNKKGGSYWGCCPFHSEKTPSFHVVPDRQMYKCFGCGKGGGAINFVMELENLSFGEADQHSASLARSGRQTHRRHRTYRSPGSRGGACPRGKKRVCQRLRGMLM